jgi:hypothetical protein
MTPAIRSNVVDEEAKVPTDNRSGAKKRTAAKPAVAGDAPHAVAPAAMCAIGASARAGCCREQLAVRRASAGTAPRQPAAPALR